jgi:hypothetical protein
VSRLKTVVLPAPFGPMSACIAPRRTLRSTPSTATKPLNSLVRPCVSRMVSPVMEGLRRRGPGRVGLSRLSGECYRTRSCRQGGGAQKSSRNS